MNYRKYIEKDDLNESFFGEIFNMVKTGKELKKMAETLPKADKKNPEQMIKAVNDKIHKGLAIIQKSKCNDDVKDSMRKGFLGGVFGKLYNELDMSGDELQKMFGWDKKLYIEMLRAKE